MGRYQDENEGPEKETQYSLKTGTARDFSFRGANFIAAKIIDVVFQRFFLQMGNDTEAEFCTILWRDKKSLILHNSL